jgi:hypothetical protein
MRYVRRNQLDVGLKDAFEWMFTFGRSYMSVGSDRDSIGAPLIKAEDPRQTITAVDPVTGRPAPRSSCSTTTSGPRPRVPVAPRRAGTSQRPRRALKARCRCSPRARSLGRRPVRDWEDDQVVPVVEFVNRNGVGEFERHLDVLDRINHMLLQRMVIATFQAFRQRAIKVENAEDMPDKDPETGEPIDYDDIFAADPGALWQLPKAPTCGSRRRPT